MGESKSDSIRLKVLPLERDAPIKLESQLRPHVREGLQIAGVRAVKLIPQYQLVIDKMKSEPVISRR
jgi:hypothetical protein